MKIQEIAALMRGGWWLPAQGVISASAAGLPVAWIDKESGVIMGVDMVRMCLATDCRFKLGERWEWCA
ncbi:MAG: hypothetical protein KJN79_04485 [Gammaproteobacteria bacterium]|nr:hypothetical protein [Gammaproteobacteria bacterium]